MLDYSNLNFWAILVAWLINIGLGSFWYSPAGFGKKWSKLSGVDMMKTPKEETNKAIVFVVIGALIQTFVLAVIVHSLHVTQFFDGLWLGVFLWAGFTAVTTIGTTLYSRLSWNFWWLNASFFLIVMGVDSILLAIWR